MMRDSMSVKREEYILKELRYVIEDSTNEPMRKYNNTLSNFVNVIPHIMY